MVPSLVTLMVGLAQQSSIHTLNLSQKVCNHSMSDINSSVSIFQFRTTLSSIFISPRQFILNVNS